MKKTIAWALVDEKGKVDTRYVFSTRKEARELRDVCVYGKYTVKKVEVKIIK